MLYPGVKEKSFQMLMAWFERGKSVTFNELSRALQALGKDRLAKKYCFLNFKVCLTNTIPTIRRVFRFFKRKDQLIWTNCIIGVP